MVYIKKRHIAESRRLISDIIEIAKIKKKIGSFVVIMGIQKAFDSFDSLGHNFLISTLEKYGLGKYFIL